MTLREALTGLGPTGKQRLSELIGVDARNVVAVIERLVERESCRVRGPD